MRPPEQKTTRKMYVVFAPDGKPMVQTLTTTKGGAKELAVESMQQGFAASWPNWKKLEIWGSSVQSVAITIEINEP